MSDDKEKREDDLPIENEQTTTPNLEEQKEEVVETISLIKESETPESETPEPEVVEPTEAIEPTELLTEEVPIVKKKNTLGIWIAVAVVVVAAFLGYSKGLFSSSHTKDMPVAYVKDDNLYIDDLKNKPYQAAEALSSGGNYSYYYTAWGVLVSEDGKTIYFSDNITEDGRFDLYKRTVAQGQDATLISSGVMNYQISNDGAVCVYLKATEGDKIGLYSHDGLQEMLVTDNAVLSENSFQLSQDGTQIIYEMVQEDGISGLAANTLEGSTEKMLTNALVQFSIAKETGKIYYVGQEGESYSIFEYTFGQEPVLVSKNAVAMEVLGNNKDILFCTQSSIQIQSSAILEDDIAEQDAAVPTPDFVNGTEAEKKAYDEKAARDEVRLALADGKFESPMQDCFIWSDGKVITVDTEILNAKAAVSKEGFVLYSKIDTSNLPKVKLSSIKSLDEAKYMYYVNLSGAPRNTYFTKVGGTPVSLEQDSIAADSFSVAANGQRISFNVLDPLTGSSTFYTAALDKDAKIGEQIELGSNIQMNEFSGEGESLYWLEDADEALQEGKLTTFENGQKTTVAEKVNGFRVAEDSTAVYYINDIQASENGNLSMFANGTTTAIDTEVFCMQYKGNGNVVYMKNYDVNTGIGDLYYWNGKTSRLIDEGVSAIFIF